MKSTEMKPARGRQGLNKSGSDRLAKVAILATFFLIAAAAAIGTDMWLNSPTGGAVAVAVEPTQPPPAASDSAQLPVPAPSPTHGLLPTASPTAETAESPAFETDPTMVRDNTVSVPLTPPACVPPDSWGIHIVQPGNTLYSLAQRYSTDVDTLMYVNCLNTNTIFTNQRLYVPGSIPASSGPMAMPTEPQATGVPQPGPTVAEGVEVAADAAPPPSATPVSRFQVSIPDHYLNIALLGSDRRPNTGHWRTDSMIIVSVDLETNVVRLLSIPRDLWVMIPGHGYNRVNTADLWGELHKKGTGPDRVKQTIYQNLGIAIDYYVRIDFQGFMKIVDSVGGVDIDVDCPLPDIKLSAGMHHMSGKQALRYARSRKSTNDFDRGRRQRKVLLALWEQTLNMNVVPKLPGLWRSMADAFQTDLPLHQVINLAYMGVQIEPQHILSTAIGPKQVQSWMTPQGASVLLPREAEIRALLEKFYSPVDPGQLNTAEKVRVRVINGSQRSQAEELAAANLRWAGFKVTNSSLADRQDYGQTRLLVFNGELDAAQQIAQTLRVASADIQDMTGIKDQPIFDQSVDVQVILGSDYNPCQR